MLAKRRNFRKGIILIARQHPGETGGSYMMQGVLSFITGDSEEAQFLRENCVFKIVPMINPDGVIYGNYRTSLLGCDLNRRWKNPKRVSAWTRSPHLKLDIPLPSPYDARLKADHSPSPC